MTGQFPGARDKDFVKRNMDFLTFQIDVIKPKLIITQGKPASINHSYLSEQFKIEWACGKALSTPSIGLKKKVLIDNQEYTCVALEHTSMRNQNVKRRVYKNESGIFTGRDAEIEMLKESAKI